MFIPTYYAKSIYDIPIQFYKENNIKIIFCDLDNTLDPFYVKEPTLKAYNLVKNLQDNDIQLIITSNNHGERVTRYSKLLGVECHYSSQKPLGYRLRRFIKKNNFNPNEIVMIGDQLLTDVIASKNTKVRSILTEPSVKGDLPITRFNRVIDKFIRRIIKKKLKSREVL